jgi:hypothetical protein
MCKPSMIDALNLALGHPEHFPAGCCCPFPYNEVKDALTTEQIALYNYKYREYSTPRAVRIYCVNDICHWFITKDEFDNTHE